jgi:putative PIN family toxin of toxin-antitoxin system
LPPSSIRVVLDTNTLLSGLVTDSSAAASVRRAAENRWFTPLLSKPVLDEYRAVLGDPRIGQRFPSITRELTKIAIARLRFVGDYVRVPHERFEFRRDPKDAKFLELAIALNATHIVTSDEDLLSLPHSKSDEGKRFRQRLRNVSVLNARDFLDAFEHNWR